MIDCRFCAELHSYKAINDFKNDNPEYYDRNEKVLQDYHVALIVRSWTKSGGKRNARTKEDHKRGSNIGYKLNYCPECGKKIEGD